MRSLAALQAKIGIGLILVCVTFLAVSSGNHRTWRAETRIDDPSRMTVSPMLGEMCPVPLGTVGEPIPVNPVTVALAMQQAAPARP